MRKSTLSYFLPLSLLLFLRPVFFLTVQNLLKSKKKKKKINNYAKKSTKFH